MCNGKILISAEQIKMGGAIRKFAIYKKNIENTNNINTNIDFDFLIIGDFWGYMKIYNTKSLRLEKDIGEVMKASIETIIIISNLSNFRVVIGDRSGNCKIIKSNDWSLEIDFGNVMKNAIEEIAYIQNNLFLGDSKGFIKM